MATNTTIPPTEEEKQPLQKPGDYTPTTYAPPTPTATYENGPMFDELQRQINEWAAKTDPKVQAEQDAKIQRGRNFWTGANLFANVIANAINANGTAKGAPSMTFNDNAQQKMYDSWKESDKELKADRKAAQQRVDALRLQDAQFRMADKQAADKAALDAYNANYKAGEDAKKANWNRQVNDYNTEQKRQQALDDEQRGNEEWRKRQAVMDHYHKLQSDRTLNNNLELKQAAKGYNERTKTQIIGNTEFDAMSFARAEGLVAQVYGQMLKRVNTDENGNERKTSDPKYMAFNKDKDFQYSYVNAYVEDMIATDPTFKAWFDDFSKKYGKKSSDAKQGDANDFFKN